MSSASPPPAPADPGLPPVQPPSGQMILRLFLVPALIVAGLVGLFLLGPTLSGWFNRLMGRSADSRSADQFLRDLDSANPEVRWRAASDLAQVLLRKDELAADAGFALQLADRLKGALDNSADGEKSYAARVAGLPEGERRRELKKLEADRDYTIYLGACLGNFMVPVGVPLLKQMALQDSGMEPDALAERRRRAVFALATLGENLKRFDRLDDGAKDAVEAQLAEATMGERGAWARESLEYLKQRRRGKQGTLGVADVLAQCANDDDPALRLHAAFAANFWRGTAAEDEAVEKYLLRLSHDAGRGEDKMEDRLAANPDNVQSRAVVKRKGFEVQANATVALARRGSAKVRPDLLALLLDDDELRQVFVLRRRDGAEQPDEAKVALTAVNTLKAVAELHRQQPALLSRPAFKAVRERVDALAEHANPAIKSQAREAQLALRPAE